MGGVWVLLCAVGRGLNRFTSSNPIKMLSMSRIVDVVIIFSGSLMVVSLQAPQ